MKLFLTVNKDSIYNSLYCGVYGFQGDYVPVNHCLAVMLRNLLGDKSVKVHYSNIIYFDKIGRMMAKVPTTDDQKRFFAEFMNLTHDVEQRYAFLGRRIGVDIPDSVMDHYDERTDNLLVSEERKESYL